MKLYAFDVDHTLQVSDGPVPVKDLIELWLDDNIVGICGNWAVFTHAVPTWGSFINFLGPMEMEKEHFLLQLKTFLPPYEDYIFVGNDNRDPKWNGKRTSRDAIAAELSGYRFICEDDWAAGKR